jgi:hypothetical protein
VAEDAGSAASMQEVSFDYQVRVLGNDETAR